MKWQYKWVDIPDARWREDILILDREGEDGWETTGIREESDFSVKYLMKRPIQEEAKWDLPG